MLDALLFLLILILAVLVMTPVMTMLRIVTYGRKRSGATADAAVVLGAAIVDGKPTPVFRERINHGIALWREGRVRVIVLTGGWGSSERPSESAAAREYALSEGVPPNVILTEDKSRTTFENMVHAREVMESHGLRTALIVSDPIHMKRSMRMARDNGLRALPSPTPTTRFISARKKLRFLWKETWSYLAYLVLGY